MDLINCADHQVDMGGAARGGRSLPGAPLRAAHARGRRGAVAHLEDRRSPRDVHVRVMLNVMYNLRHLLTLVVECSSRYRFSARGFFYRV